MTLRPPFPPRARAVARTIDASRLVWPSLWLAAALALYGLALLH